MIWEENDLLSQEQIVKEFMNCQQKLRAMAYAMCTDYHLVDDIMQEVIITLINKREKFDSSRAFAPWAAGITRFKVLEELRKNKKLPIALEDETLLYIQNQMFTEMQDIDLQERSNAMMKCLRKLPDNSSQILSMKYIKRLSVKEISSEVKRSITGTQSLLQRLRGKVLECVKKELQSQS